MSIKTLSKISKELKEFSDVLSTPDGETLREIISEFDKTRGALEMGMDIMIDKMNL